MNSRRSLAARMYGISGEMHTIGAHARVDLPHRTAGLGIDEASEVGSTTVHLAQAGSPLMMSHDHNRPRSFLPSGKTCGPREGHAALPEKPRATRRTLRYMVDGTITAMDQPGCMHSSER